uniref:Helicase C-terminal domain-containing protein n=1 Tax=Anopheles maculatus TaxID=74869 RepID=A0A182SWE7_9DIPT
MNEYTSNDITGEPGRTKKFKLIADYTSLRKIWTHPKVLEKAWEAANLEKNRKDAARKTATPDTDDESPDDNNDIASGQLSVTNDWWRRYLQIADLESLYPSNKLWILFEILKQSNERGEKVLIFTAFVSVLNMVEHFMAKIHNQSNNPLQADEYAYSAFKGPWCRGRDYYRLDGKTPKSDRHAMITSFNDPQNTHTKCFLISAKAGGQGINLTGANRVIILDTSWNPSNDQQNIFRIFRLGQKRNCYVYRLIAAGTMEEKVYSRSVTKQALSYRVVDEQQIDRHYSYGELAELYTLTKLSEMTRETPILPADDVLASLLRTFPNKILKYHEHDSLLENKPEQDLSEEEKKEAWAAYEREIQNNENRSYLSQFGSLGAAAAAAGGLFGSSAYGASLGSYYAGLGYGGLSGLPMGAGSDLYRNDYSSYNGALSRAAPPYMPFGHQFPSILNDPAYTTALAKLYNFPIPGATGMDYGAISSLQSHAGPMGNGQSMMPPGAAGGPMAGQGNQLPKGFNSVSLMTNMLNLYTGKAGGSGLGAPSTASLGALGSSAANVSLAEMAAQHSAANSSNSLNHYNPLQQINSYAQSNS